MVSVIGLGTNNLGLKLDLEQSSAQNEYPLLDRKIEADLVPALRHSGSPTPSSSLSIGCSDSPASAASPCCGVTIGGLAAQPTVASVIAGATTTEQVQANVCAARWSPLAGDLAELDAITM